MRSAAALLALLLGCGAAPFRIDGVYDYSAGPLSGKLTVYESAEPDAKGRLTVIARWTLAGIVRDGRGVLDGQHLTLTLDYGDPGTQTLTVEALVTPGSIDGEITGNGLVEEPFSAIRVNARRGKTLSEYGLNDQPPPPRVQP